MAYKKFDHSPPKLPPTYGGVLKEWEEVVRGFDHMQVLRNPTLANRCMALCAIVTNVRAGVPFDVLMNLSFNELLQLNASGRKVRDLAEEAGSASAAVIAIILHRLRIALSDQSHSDMDSAEEGQIGAILEQMALLCRKKQPIEKAAE